MASFGKPFFYVVGGVAAAYGIYYIAVRRPNAALGLVFGAAQLGGFQPPPQQPPHAPPKLDLERGVGPELDADEMRSSQAVVFSPRRQVEPLVLTLRHQRQTSETPRPSPRAQSALETPKPSPRRPGEPLSPRTLENVRVLVVEDEPVNALVTRRRLNSLGATVDVVTDAAAALRALEEHAEEIDVVLMDNNMPMQAGGPAVGDAGLQAATRIRAMSDSGEEQPAIIMHSSNSIPQEVLSEVGAVTEIVKGQAKSEEYADTILDVIEKKKVK